MRKYGFISVIICYVMWGLLPMFWRTLAALDSFYVLCARVTWSLVFISLILLVCRKGLAIREVASDRKELCRLAVAGVLIGVNWGTYIWAVNSGHMLDASLAYYMNPILAVLLGTLVFRERLTKLQWMAVGMAFAGIVTAVVRSGEIPWIALVIGGTFALYGAVKKGVRSDAGVSVFYETLFLSPVTLIFMIQAEWNGNGAVGVLQGPQWLLLPMAGVVTTLPLLAFAKGIKTTPMVLSGLLMYINPTLQLLISVIVFQEKFTVTYAILFGFVWSGLALYLLSGLREWRKKEDTLCA